MRKRIICIFVLFLLFCSQQGQVSADNTNKNDHALSIIVSFELNQTVSRKQCVSSIMKMLGMSEKSAKAAVFEYCYYQNPFEDLSWNDTDEGYVIAAKDFITAGVGTSDQGSGKNFEPERAVTVKECLAFMLRCLKGFDCVAWDSIENDAEEAGLLKNGEVKKDSINNSITGELFLTLMERMLNMNRHLFCLSDDKEYLGFNYYIDMTCKVKYVDWVLNKKTQEDDSVIKISW